MNGLATSLILLAAALGAPAPCGAQEAAVSTAAPVSSESPLMLNFFKDARDSRVGLDYAVRWDFKDLPAIRPSLGGLYNGLKSVSSWDITENTRVNYYGLKTNPWRIIISKEKSAPPAAGAGPAGGGVVARPAAEYHKRLRLSVSPLVDDIKRNFDENLGEFLLKSSLKGTSPEWEKMGAANRKTLVRGVLALDIWKLPVPGVETAREGLEFVSKDKKPAAVDSSTAPVPAGK
jgi:hypothetical protein